MLVSRISREIFFGLALSVAVTAAAFGMERAMAEIFGYPWLDSLVLAIGLGTLVRTAWGLHPRFQPGVGFASKTLLEIAIVFLGASISASALVGSGPAMMALVTVIVLCSLIVSYGIGRLLGLDHKLALLVSCGNSICGNSAIVAAAPVVEARSEDVAASIAFTAALGILVVLMLPLGFRLSGMSEWQYGVVAGMTVYAVPQVLAATVPVGVVSTQIGTLVKLMRVLMLGPVILLIGLGRGRRGNRRLSLFRIVPWFILGFIAMMAARSFGLVPDAALAPIQDLASGLTVVSMAALGLSVNLRTVLASGGRVLAAGSLSILALFALSLAAVTLLREPAPASPAAGAFSPAPLARMAPAP